MAVVTTGRDGSRGLGSGFILNADHIATNLHVVAGRESFMVLRADEARQWLKPAISGENIPVHRTAKVIYPERQTKMDECYRALELAKKEGTREADDRVLRACKPDLAILELSEPLRNVETVELTRKVPDSDMTVLAYGFPADSWRTFDVVSDENAFALTGTGGKLNHGYANADYLLQHQAAINNGSSGGPLFDVCGRVIGTNFLKSHSSEWAYAVYAGVLLDALKGLSVAHEEAGGPCLSTPRGVSEERVHQMIVDRDIKIVNVLVRVMDSVMTVIVVVVCGGFVVFMLSKKSKRKNEIRWALASLVVLLVIGWLLWPLRPDAVDADGREQVGDVAGRIPNQSSGGQTAGESVHSAPTVRLIPAVWALPVDNQSLEDIVAVRAMLPGTPGGVELPGTPIPAGTYRILALPEYNYGNQCSFAVRVEPEKSGPFESTRNLCLGESIDVYSGAPFLVKTVPEDAELRIKSDDGRVEWRFEDGPMPPKGKLIRYGDYHVEARKRGYMSEEELITHGWGTLERRIVLCRTGADADQKLSFFKDSCDKCPKEMPKMVVLPAGCYRMGEEQRTTNRVTIDGPLAVGVYEVTYAEWKACADDGGCESGSDVGREGYAGRKQNPAFNVSWYDAKDYVGWLAKTTGKPYRLLSESEWEYVARARTETKYSFLNAGDRIEDESLADCLGCGGRWDEYPERVGSFPTNRWGLHDVHGNVQEWVEDCWRESASAPPYTYDGSAWVGEDGDGSCRNRVVRGGSWSHFTEDVRSASRNGLAADGRDTSTGFRVARDRHEGDDW